MNDETYTLFDVISMQGTKNVLCKNKQNAGLVQYATKNACICMKNQLVKNYTNKEGASSTLQPAYSPHKAAITPPAQVAEGQDNINVLSCIIGL